MRTRFNTKQRSIPGTSESLWFDGNSKVSVVTRFEEQPVVNAFSLISIDDCPFSTPVCRSSCYTAKIKTEKPEVFAKYEQNSRTIHTLLDQGMEGNVMATFRNHLVDEGIKFFRWHVSGDVFSKQYAALIREISVENPETQFWIYTRSFPYVGSLVGSENLVVNLSGDCDNEDQVRETWEKFPETRVCWMSTDGRVPEWLPSNSVIFPDYALRGRSLEVPTSADWWQGLTVLQRRMVCPPDFFGQSDSLRCGPCRKCIRDPSTQLVQMRTKSQPE